MLRRLLLSFALAFACLELQEMAHAQKPAQPAGQKQPNSTASVSAPSKEPLPNPKDNPPKENPKDRQFAITPAREAAVMAFVERNHPELAGLLSHLKTNQPKEYERAVRDLFRSTEKLATIQERDGKQYDLELKAWQAQSRAQLLVAKLKMTDPESGDSEDLKKQLRETLSEQMQARLEVMRLERERVSGRLGKLNEEITRMEKNRDSVVESHLKNLTSQVNANRPKAKTPEKKPVKKP
jgi:hypothetical protein